MRDAIVVGYDGSGPSKAALAWAAAEAASRHRPLLLVHAVAPPVPTTALGYAVPPDLDSLDQLCAGARTVLEKEAAAVAADYPGLEVRTDTVVGSASAALVERSAAADLVVVGSRGHGGFRGLLLGSVGVQTASHASGPVVVVRRPVPPEADRVVVGVDGSECGQLALEFALDLASRHGWGVVVVHAWQQPSYDVLAVPVAPPAALVDVEDDEVRLTGETMAGAREDHPDVEIHELVVKSPAVRALMSAAQTTGGTAAAIVVGSRGRGELMGTLLGSVSHGLLHHATVPVAVVRPRTGS